MLSRVAERIYWLGRYLERTENTARLINVYANLMFDMPKDIPIGWDLLPNIMGGKKEFEKNYPNMDERSVIKFLLADKTFTGSILNAAIFARENARTTREVLPNEAWELINELYLYISDSHASVQSRNKRNHFLVGLIRRCQHIGGMLNGTMNRDAAYDFMIMGRNLERADMTTRILDTGAFTALDPDDEFFEAYENIIWLNVLDSLGAVQMFRKLIRDRIDRAGILKFLLNNRFYPRSISYCLEGVENAIHTLPENTAAQRAISHTRLHLKNSDLEVLENIQLHEFLDKLQMNFNNIHLQIAASWFSLEHSQSQSQSNLQENKA